MNIGHRALAGLAALLGLAYLVYSPGLSGGYLFDDFVNLDAIGATGPVDNWQTLFRFLTSGTADPTGRPLALLSFLIDARDWPVEPAGFLRTNVLLHLLNGALLFFLLQALGRRIDPDDNKTELAALLGAGLWLLHPLLVSTTLYIVQREAMLPATFVLVGLLCYVRGRRLVTEGALSRGLAWMVAGILGGTGLALLCKGNGILLPMLAGVLEVTILRFREGPVSNPVVRRIHWVLLWVPSLAVVIYLASFLIPPGTVNVTRGWTPGQRLLTETRVLIDYLQLLVIPRSISSGIYNESYQLSTGLMEPLSTFFSTVALLALTAFAWRVKRRSPALSAGILFYLAGHLLESTTIPLELYFEHRNYLPAMLLFWPVARGIFAMDRSQTVKGLLAFAVVALFALTTFHRAQLWGQPDKMSSIWAQQKPGSSRAQATAAMMEANSGSPERALSRLRPIWQQRPNDLQIAFNFVNAACMHRGLSREDSGALAHSLRHAKTDLQLINRWLLRAIDIAASEECPGLTLDVVEGWLAAVAANPHFRRRDPTGSEFEPLLAQLALLRGLPDVALQHFDRALEAFPTPDVAARQASELARQGYYAQALHHLDAYERIKHLVPPPSPGMPQLHAWVLHRQGYWPREMLILRSKLQAEMDSQKAPAN